MNKNVKSRKLEGLGRFFRSILHPVTSIFIVTILIAILLVISNKTSFEGIVSSWGTGLKANFGYCMQFMLLLLLSYTLGMTPIYLKIVRSMGKLFTNERSSIIGLVLFSSILSWFSWALGVVGGVFLAQTIGLSHQKAGKSVNFPLLVASGLSGLVVSESGVSGNVMLFMTKPSSNFSLFPTISITDSVFSTLNITANIMVIIGLIVILILFSGKGKSKVIDTDQIIDKNENKKPKSFAELMESSQLVSLAFGGIGLAYIILHFIRGGIMDLNTYLLLLIASGIFLRKGPLSFQADVSSASSYAWIFFFPLIFSGAIQGMINIQETGSFFHQILISLKTESIFASFNMLFSALGHFIIPNTGAGWIIEGQNILTAGQRFNSSPLIPMLSFCYGAGVAKLLNIFILLPILKLINIKYRSILKYIASMAAVSAIVYLVALLIFI